MFSVGQSGASCDFRARASANYFREQTIVRYAIDLHVIFLVQMTGRVGDPGRPLRIIGQEQQAFAGLIQSTDRTDPRQARVQQTINRLASFFVRRGRHHTPRLTHEQVDRRRFAKPQPVDLNLVNNTAIVHSRRRFRVSSDAPVESDTPSANQSARLRTRTIALLRKRSRQADAFLRDHYPYAKWLIVSPAWQARSFFATRTVLTLPTATSRAYNVAISQARISLHRRPFALVA